MALAPVVGAALVVLVLVDVVRTVVLPVASGWVLEHTSRVLLRVARALPGRVRDAALRVVGPLTVVLPIVLWLLTLWLGFALIYLPVVDGLAYDPFVDFGSRGLLEALYLSGTALATLGFGDVVGQSAGVRLLTVAQAGTGLALVTATLGYLPAIYTVVSPLRSASQAVADLDADDPETAARLVSAGGSAVLDAVRRDVLLVRQHLQRFPVLHNFRPPPDESVVALASGGLGLWVAAHFTGPGAGVLPQHVKALEQALRRLVDVLAERALGDDDCDREWAVERFAEAREVARDSAAAARSDVPESSLDLLRHARSVLDAYAQRHGDGGRR